MFHMFFVGMMTNLVFGVVSAATEDARQRHHWAEPAAMWLLNIGLVGFVVLRIVSGGPLRGDHHGHQAAAWRRGEALPTAGVAGFSRGASRASASRDRYRAPTFLLFRGSQAICFGESYE
jgi:hypothetical protein